MFDYDISYLKGDMGVANPSGLQNLVGFFGSVQGAAQDWLFNDPSDNSVTDMQFATGDGFTVAFQLIRSVGGMPDIIQNLNGVPVIKINGNVVLLANYSISTTGVVTFTTPPVNTGILTWTGSFFFRCRFEEDTLAELQEELFQIWGLSSLKFRSVIL
jgi:uncharacterized protein (TIGR02217 family)